MRHHIFFRLAAGGLMATATALSSTDAQSGSPRLVGADPNGSGFSAVYGDIPADQAEFISTPDRIKGAIAGGAPMAIWEALEHGEKVECLDCIAAVAPLLYDSRSAKTREIAAWWLRRRIFGVFGPGEVYEQTVQTLASDANPAKRAYAAYALGEFFAAPGIDACAQAVVNDADATVRAAAASALGRLNDDGAGALGTALADQDPRVRLAALGAATRINNFSAPSSVAALAMDTEVTVRRRAVEALDGLHMKDAVFVVASVAQRDTDPTVRADACHALGTFGDNSVVSVLTNLAQNDPDTFVRDQAQIALLRL